MLQQQHQERVVQERAELNVKVTKLNEFLLGTLSKSLPLAERGRLYRQYAAMKDYLGVLDERITAFGIEGEIKP